MSVLALIPMVLVPQSGQPLLDEPGRMFPSDGDETSALALADLDGDGDLDVVVGTHSHDHAQPAVNRLLRNLGGALFEDVQHAAVAAGPDVTRAVALADVDLDGDLDLYVANDGDDRLFLGPGMVEAGPGQLPAGTTGTIAVAFGDLNGDAYPDLVLGFGWGEVRLLRNDGTGRFVQAPAGGLPYGGGELADLALEDFDGDGKLDVVVARRGYCDAMTGCVGGPTELYLGSGSGTFLDVTATHLPAGVSDQTEDLVVGDLDADGDLDLVLANGLGAGWAPELDRVLLNDGSGHFAEIAGPWLAATTPPAGESRALALGDLDSDGLPDLLVADAGDTQGLAPHLRIFKGLGTGYFGEVTDQWAPLVLEPTRALAVADLDGDGDQDVVLGNRWRDRLLLGDGTGVLVDAMRLEGPPLPPTEDAGYAAALGDVDGDGDLDLVEGVYFGLTRLLLNDGAGGFVEAAGIPSLGALKCQAVALGDLDGDGDLDLVIGTLVQQDRVLLNDGAGVFGTVIDLPNGTGDYTEDVALSDVDGDGDLDLVLANRSGPSRLLLNDGAAGFAIGAGLPPDSDDTKAVAAADLDGDGDVDLVLGNHGGQDRLLLGDGSGGFVDATVGRMPVEAAWTSDVEVGDLDGDGDGDLVLGATALGGLKQNRVYLNDGSGSFADATGPYLPDADNHCRDLALGDLDGDGHPDLYLTGWGYLPGQADRLYLGSAGGFLTEASELLPPGRDSTVAVELGDLDGDGDLDVVLLNLEQEDRVLFNRTRHLDLRRPARLGKTMTLEVFGPGPGSYQLTACLGTGQVEVPPLGTLLVDLSQLLLWTGGNLDASGSDLYDLAVPAWPSMLGLEVHWQALLPFPGVLTNRVTSTVTTL